MTDFTNRELDLMSRALERAMTSLRGTARGHIATSDLAQGIIDAAVEGVRCEKLLAERALARVGLYAAAFENAGT
jgi:hypothetical protein